MKAKIVVADDEPRIRAMIALLLKEDGYYYFCFQIGRAHV